VRSDDPGSADLRGDDLCQRFEALETDVLPLADSPAAEAIRRRGRRRQRTVRVAVLVPVVLLGVAVTRGAELLTAESTLGPASPAPTTQASPPTTTPPVTPPVASPTTRERAPTTAPPTTGAGVSRTPVLRPDGLGVTAFGAAELDALAALKRRLGPPDERGSWNGASPFGTCPGPVRAVRWGRLYVLFTNGPTRYEAHGRWHLFAYQVDAIQRTAVDPNSSGPAPPPDPPPLRGASPRTAAGIGFGSTLAELRAAYGDRVTVSGGPPGNVDRFRIRLGAGGELHGSLSGSRPAATVTGIAAGAGCGE
jgi:hypothetical protein